MSIRVEITARPDLLDPRSQALHRQLGDLGVEGVERVEVTDLFFLGGDLDDAAVARLVDELLCDRVVQRAVVRASGDAPPQRLGDGAWTVEVCPKPGVTDTEADTLLESAALVGVAALRQAATGTRYTLHGPLEEATVRRVASSLLANEVVQLWQLGDAVPAPFAPAGDPDPSVALVPLLVADDARLEAISQERRLSLDLAEMRAIQAWYRQQEREPNEIELEMLAQTWSEHCVHKTFKALIDYHEVDTDGQPIGGTQRQVDGLLGEFIRGATEKLDRPWVHSAFVDNAGLVAFTEEWDVALKAETHNHPSALEPFGGANTGVGGVVRDILGVSARPIANTDVLCFGPQDMAFDDLPDGVLHPRRVADGVISGIEDYGNKMGIPTVAGAVCYDPGYTANPLVYCGCIGLLPKGSHPTEARKGDLIVSLGGRTGRDGLRGATFSSMEMTHETGQEAGSSVQIGHPIHEKQLLEVVLRARDAKLYTAITDCGAGGLSSSIGEMAEALGAEVHLERVPLKYPGLRPWEIWLSEAQERMVMAVPAENWPALQALCDAHVVEATALGHFTGEGWLRLHHQGALVAELEMGFLHDGLPRRHLQATWQIQEPKAPTLPELEDLGETLLGVLALPNVRSREEIVRRYDHEVQGGTLGKPLVGVEGKGPGDGTVLVPLDVHPEDGERGLAIGIGVNPRYGQLDPYRMAWAAVDEAVRNAVAVGADPDHVALLDNFCWGNPKLPDRLGALVRCSQGCHDAALAFGAPFVSGKDSLNNEYADASGQRRAIPGTILIHAVGVVPAVSTSPDSALTRAGQALYVLGHTHGELGGSAYVDLHQLEGGEAPRPLGDPMEALRSLHAAITAGHVQACHDCAEGGLAVSLAEMCLGGRLGATANLRLAPHDDGLAEAALTFGESSGRFIIATDHPEALEAHFGDELPLARVGTTTDAPWLTLQNAEGEVTAHVSLDAIEHAFRGHVR